MIALILALLAVLVLAVLVLASGLAWLPKLSFLLLLGVVGSVLAWGIALVLSLRTKGRSLDEAAADLESEDDDEPDDLEPRDYGT